MDELTMFAELRPDDTLDDEDLAVLRAELFGAQPERGQIAGRSGELVRLGGGGADRPRGRGVLTVAAVAVMLLGLGAVWWAIDRETGADSPISTQPSASQPSPGVSTPETIPSALPAQPRGWEGYGRPRFLFGEPGWTMSYASETSHGHGRAVVFLSDAGFDGAWVEISPTEAYEAGALPVRQVGSMSAQVSVFDEGALAYWTEPGGQPLDATIWQSDPLAVAELLESTSYVNDQVIVGVLPDGAALAEPAVAEAVGMFGSYRFVHTDGRSLDINIRGGGARGLYSHTDGDDLTGVDVDGEQWLLLDHASSSDPEASGRFRANVLRGFWAWQIDGGPFSSADAFLAVIGSISPVDEAMWASSLPDGIVAGSDQPDAVVDLLIGVPLPEGFDVTSLHDGTTNDRYQFIARVSGAVACAWLDQWFTAGESGDTDAQAQAAVALASSREWAMLSEIADQGGWSGVVWQHADAVNGGAGIGSGAGPQPPSRELARGALGCGR